MMRLQASEAADETRDEIVRQATQLFTHYGYSKTNIGDIALACDMSAGNLYRYFRNKQAIGHAVVARFFDEVDACIERGLDESQCAEARVRFVITAAVEHTVRELRQAPKIVELSEMICETEEGQAVVGEHVQRNLARLTGLVREGVANREFDVNDAEAAARAVQMGTKFFHIPFALAQHGLDRVEADLAVTLDLLCAGLRGRAAGVWSAA